MASALMSLSEPLPPLSKHIGSDPGPVLTQHDDLQIQRPERLPDGAQRLN